MMDDVNKGKRSASTPLKESQKKGNHAHHSPQEKSTRFNVLEDQAIVSSAPNRQILPDPIADLMLDEESDKWARTPYSTLFGQDEGDKTAFHDDLLTILTIAGKWVHTKNTLTAEQLKAIKQSKEDNPVITTAKWRRLNLLLFSKDMTSKTSALTDHERSIFRCISSRLAHTKPKIIATTRVINSKMIGSNATRAWRGAVDILGSLYFVPKSSNLMSNQITDFYPSVRTATEATAKRTMLVPPSPAPTQQQQTESTKGTNTATTVNPYAKKTATQVAETLKHKARLSVAIKIEKDTEKPANDQAIEQIKQLLRRYLQND
ncbi:MAG: hypothetical protein ACRCT2_09865, partial [Plesiomonas shigelloides]